MCLVLGCCARRPVGRDVDADDDVLTGRRDAGDRCAEAVEQRGDAAIVAEVTASLPVAGSHQSGDCRGFFVGETVGVCGGVGGEKVGFVGAGAVGDCVRGGLAGGGVACAGDGVWVGVEQGCLHVT